MSNNASESAEVGFTETLFKKRSTKQGALRKRTRNEENDDAIDEEYSVINDYQLEKKKKVAPVHVFSTGNWKRRELEDSDVEDEDKLTAVPIIKSTRDAMPLKVRGGATSLNETETSIENDARAIMERSIALQAEDAPDDIKVYKGQAGYKQHIAKTQNQVASNKHTGTQGPIRAPQYARTTSVFDYQPDICKDYKETGYCGFGDSCKFLHDRGDYKAGWQQELEWNSKQKLRKEREMLAFQKFSGGDAENVNDVDEKDEKYAISDEETELPFACFICREGFKDPVVTNCGHYFCEMCALERYRENSRCIACGKETGGVFNYAKRLVDLMTKKGLLKKKVAADDEDFEVKDELELTVQSVSRKAQGGWQSVED